MEDRSLLKREYVYHADNSDDYRNVQVIVSPRENAVEVAVIPENMTSLDELNGILRDINGDVLEKLRISLTEECSVVLKHGGQSYAVTLEGDPPRASGLQPLAG